MDRKVKVLITQEYELTLTVNEASDHIEILNQLNYDYDCIGRGIIDIEGTEYQNTKVVEIDGVAVYIENGLICDSGNDIILDGQCRNKYGTRTYIKNDGAIAKLKK